MESLEPSDTSSASPFPGERGVRSVDGHGRALHTGKISFREQVRPHHKKVTYKLDIKKISTRPIPAIFAEAVAEVDGKLSIEVGGVMVGLFADLEYKYP